MLVDWLQIGCLSARNTCCTKVVHEVGRVEATAFGSTCSRHGRTELPMQPSSVIRSRSIHFRFAQSINATSPHAHIIGTYCGISPPQSCLADCVECVSHLQYLQLIRVGCRTANRSAQRRLDMCHSTVMRCTRAWQPHATLEPCSATRRERCL